MWKSSRWIELVLRYQWDSADREVLAWAAWPIPEWAHDSIDDATATTISSAAAELSVHLLRRYQAADRWTYAINVWACDGMLDREYRQWYGLWPAADPKQFRITVGRKGEVAHG